jgi:hypothetical protein
LDTRHDLFKEKKVGMEAYFKTNPAKALMKSVKQLSLAVCDSLLATLKMKKVYF